MLRTKLVVVTPDATWVRDMSLPIPPFPGLGIRIDTYEVVHVDSVVVGDPGVDVTCIGRLEGSVENASADKLGALGFEIAPYP